MTSAFTNPFLSSLERHRRPEILEPFFPPERLGWLCLEELGAWVKYLRPQSSCNFKKIKMADEESLRKKTTTITKPRSKSKSHWRKPQNLLNVGNREKGERFQFHILGYSSIIYPPHMYLKIGACFLYL